MTDRLLANQFVVYYIFSLVSLEEFNSGLVAKTLKETWHDSANGDGGYPGATVP